MRNNPKGPYRLNCLSTTLLIKASINYNSPQRVGSDIIEPDPAPQTRQAENIVPWGVIMATDSLKACGMIQLLTC